MLQVLPTLGRPRLNNYRKLALGVDVSRAFYDNLKAIDSNFFLVWHPFKVIWDEIINEGIGSNNDPRYAIQEQCGQLCFGYVMRNSRNTAPLLDNTWHVWLLNKHVPGWCHIIQLQSLEPEYLNIVLENLNLQKQILLAYGPRGLTADMKDKEAAAKDKALKYKEEMHKLWQRENSWLVRKAMANAASGFTAATNPTKDVIMSGAGMSYRTKLVRPITEKEGGIVNPED